MRGARGARVLQRFCRVAVVGALAACDPGGSGSARASDAGDASPGGVAAAPEATVEPATRVLSLFPPATDVLLALGAGDVLVGRTIDDPYLMGSGLPEVGPLAAPATEPVIQLQTDLIVYPAETLPGWAIGRVRPIQAALRPLAMDRLALYPAAIRTLGDWVGRSDEAEVMAVRLEADLARWSQAAPGEDAARVLWLVWGEPLMAVGSRSLQHDLIVAAGGQNALANASRPLSQLSPKDLERIEADFVFWSGPSEVPDAVRSALPAVTALDPDLFNGPGSRAAEAVRALAEVIHSDHRSQSGPESPS